MVLLLVAAPEALAAKGGKGGGGKPASAQGGPSGGGKAEERQERQAEREERQEEHAEAKAEARQERSEERAARDADPSSQRDDEADEANGESSKAPRPERIGAKEVDEDEPKAEPTKSAKPRREGSALGEEFSKDKKAPVRSTPNHDLTHTLKIERKGLHQELSWVPENESTLGYQVWRSNSPFALIATLPADTTNYVDPQAPANSKYKVTYFTEESVEEGFVPADAEPATLPEWNPTVYAAAVALDDATTSWGTWVALLEGVLIVGGLSVAVARPESSARAARTAHTRILRATAQTTITTIVWGERVERLVGSRLGARFTDAQLHSLFRFLMSEETRPAPPAPPEPEMPRLTVERLRPPIVAET